MNVPKFAIQLLSSSPSLTAGLSILNAHNVWVLDWTLIVTLFGWALVLGGAARIVAPSVVDDVGSAMMERPTTSRRERNRAGRKRSMTTGALSC